MGTENERSLARLISGSLLLLLNVTEPGRQSRCLELLGSVVRSWFPLSTTLVVALPPPGAFSEIAAGKWPFLTSSAATRVIRWLFLAVKTLSFTWAHTNNESWASWCTIACPSHKFDPSSDRAGCFIGKTPPAGAPSLLRVTMAYAGAPHHAPHALPVSH